MHVKVFHTRKSTEKQGRSSGTQLLLKDENIETLRLTSRLAKAALP